MPISSVDSDTEELDSNLSSSIVKVFGDTEEVRQLAANLEAAEDGTDDKRHAWLAIAKLQSAIRCSRDNADKFATLLPIIEEIRHVVEACVEYFDGKLYTDEEMAHEVIQLMFKISNFYSIQGDREVCTKWLTKQKEFIANNKVLQNTADHAVWHNLIGGHLSRAYHEGIDEVHSLESIEHFREAVRIRMEHLDQRVRKPECTDLRHVVMCLASTLAQRAESLVLYDGTISPEVMELCVESLKVSESLTTDVLVNAKREPDHYRRAGASQWQAKVEMILGNLVDAKSEIEFAETEMEQHCEQYNAHGQLAMIKVDVAGIYQFYSYFCTGEEKENLIRLSQQKLNEAISICVEYGTEPMYKEQAQRDLEAGSNNRFISLAQAVYSTARKNEASKAAYHFLLTLLRGFIMFGTSSMVECAAIRYGDSCQDNVTEANITLALQAPGFYNQFRHFVQHASGVFIGTRLGDTVHTATHLLPHMPGPEDLVAGVSKHARLTN